MKSIPNWEQIENSILKHDYCCGCGVCGGICPVDALQMRFNEYGEYRPKLIGECTECGLCAKVCPFIDGNPNEDTLSKKLFADVQNIKYTVETGYYCDTFVGHVTDHNARVNSASGGMATWLLEKLLSEKAADYALCVSPNNDPDKMFGYKVCRSAEDIRGCRRSCYYPVTTQEVLSFVAENDGRYAVVGLPCVCKAIRLAQNHSKKLRTRIKYLVGLVCGQTKNKFFVEYICALAGGDPHKLSKVQFRVKDLSRPASDYGLRFTCGPEKGSTLEGTVFFKQGMDRIWADRYFTQNACNFCDDVFSECADVVFMDAWMPEYAKNPEGESFVLTRDYRINELFEHEAKYPQGTTVRRLSVESIIRSQLGVICSKRGGMRHRIALLKEEGLYVPVKRWNLPTLFRPLGMRRINVAQYRMSRQSSASWVACGKDLDAFKSKMQVLLDELDDARRKFLSHRIPNAVLRRGGIYKKWATTRFYS